MPTTERRYPIEEVARRGKELFATIKHQVASPDSIGKVVAIDIESGDYEVDADQLMAAERLLERHPSAPIWFERIGYRGVHHFGGCAIREPI